MATDIKCPSCGFGFPMEEAVSEEYKRELREQMIAYKKQKDEELQKQREELGQKEKDLEEIVQKQELEFNNKLSEERKKWSLSIEENLRKSIESDFENQIRLLQQSNQEYDEKLKAYVQRVVVKAVLVKVTAE